jgi:GntR family transcriptional repressor for pyruvate dehydrogenase complex
MTEDPAPATVEAPTDAPRPRPIPNTRRTEKISEVIAREIVNDSRGLPPGTMLPSEAKLLEKYGVGRGTIREALRLLEVNGLIVMRSGPGGGPMVSEVDSADVAKTLSLYFQLAGATYRDTLDARLLLEPVVAGTVARERRPEHIKALEDYLERSRPADAATEGLLPQDERAVEFHALLMDMAGNPVISLLARSLQDLLIDRWSASGERFHHGPDFATVDDMDVHDLIARAIVEGRSADAESLMREHMVEFVRYQREHDPRRLEQPVQWY